MLNMIFSSAQEDHCLKNQQQHLDDHKNNALNDQIDAWIWFNGLQLNQFDLVHKQFLKFANNGFLNSPNDIDLIELKMCDDQLFYWDHLFFN